MDAINQMPDPVHYEATVQDGDGFGWRVTVAHPYGNGWGVGVTFPTKRGAQMVATAIELAQKDEA